MLCQVTRTTHIVLLGLMDELIESEIFRYGNGLRIDQLVYGTLAFTLKI